MRWLLLLLVSCSQPRPWDDDVFIYDREDDIARNLTDPLKDEPASRFAGAILLRLQTFEQIEDLILDLQDCD